MSYLQKLQNLLQKNPEEMDVCNKTVRGNSIKVEDRVLVDILAFDGKHKISNRWKEDPYVVMAQQNPEIHVLFF